jgi:hypothetical protein
MHLTFSRQKKRKTKISYTHVLPPSTRAARGIRATLSLAAAHAIRSATPWACLRLRAPHVAWWTRSSHARSSALVHAPCLIRTPTRLLRCCTPCYTTTLHRLATVCSALAHHPVSSTEEPLASLPWHPPSWPLRPHRCPPSDTPTPVLGLIWLTMLVFYHPHTLLPCLVLHQLSLVMGLYFRLLPPGHILFLHRIIISFLIMS